MKQKILFVVLIILALNSACGANETLEPTLTPVPTSTPDPCSATNLPGEVKLLNNLMREFDDYSALASKTPQDQVIQLIPDMQRVLRESEDLQVPPCLTTLKKLQLAHMNLVIQTLVAFINSADPQLINTGINQSRELHREYDLEVARLLGITLVVPTVADTPVGNSTPVQTEPPVIVTNLGPSFIYLRITPEFDGLGAGTLSAGATAVAVGRTEDAQWIKVEIPNQPGQTAWVYAPLVQISVPVEQLPVSE